MTVENPGDLAIVPIIVGLVEVLKRLGLPTKWAPLAALALGVAGSYFFLAPGDARQAIYLGLATGLAAVGLYSGSRTTVAALRSNTSR